MVPALLLTLVVLTSLALLVGFRDIDWNRDGHNLRQAGTISAATVLLLAISNAVWIAVISAIVSYH
jgi:hypothetical protein